MSTSRQLNHTTMTQFQRPDFLCIGAKKAGTYWFTHNLCQHPEVWMPPIKEIRYFDDDAKFPKGIYLFQKTHFGRETRWVLNKCPKTPTNAAWLLRFLCLPRSDAWYSALFMPKPGQLCGEGAPTYAALPEAKIAHIRSLWPNTRILYFLRDPVERVWSNVKMWVHVTFDHPIEKLSTAEVLQILERRWHFLERESRYLDIIQRWQRHYPVDQMHINFFDELARAPVDFYLAILRFLNLATTPNLVPPELHLARNERPSMPMPVEIHRWITIRLYDELEALHQHFDHDATAAWLQRGQEIMT